MFFSESEKTGLLGFFICKSMFLTSMDWSVLIVAKRQKAHSSRFSRAGDLGGHPRVLCHNVIYLDRRRRRSLSTVGCNSQSCCDDSDLRSYCLLFPAASTDDFLLFSHCPHLTHQGNNTDSTYHGWLFSEAF